MAGESKANFMTKRRAKCWRLWQS